MSGSLALETGGGAAPLARAAGWLGRLAGWRRAAAAALIGAAVAFALPPAYLTPLWWLCLPALIWMIRGSATARGAFWTGWWFGLGHFIFGLYWISVALWVDIARFWWAVPLAVAGLPMLLGVFTGFGAALFKALQVRWRLAGIAEALLFAAIWTVMEWLRGHLFTGFPWNLAGYGWSVWLPVLQATSVVGIYGLSLLTVAAAAMPAAFGGDPALRRQAMAGTLGGLVLFALIAGWGAWRMAGTEGQVVPDVTLRIVQPGVDQREKWRSDTRLDNFRRLQSLSAGPGWDRVTHVIWPETAVPFWIGDDPEFSAALLKGIGGVAPRDGLVLTGIPRISRDAGGQRQFWNSLIAVDGAGQVQATFDKFHLVPFGEYLPLRWLFPEGAVSAIAAGLGDTSAGPGPRTLSLPGLPPLSPLICYEVIFPGAVTPRPSGADDADGERGRPGWLLNLTNDAWYGHTAGPYQHFDIARVRAVEEGVPLVRAANTGISGIVDPYGRVTASLGLGEVGVLDAALPVATARGTLYSRWGDMTLVLVLSIVLLVVGIFSRRV